MFWDDFAKLGEICWNLFGLFDLKLACCTLGRLQSSSPSRWNSFLQERYLDFKRELDGSLAETFMITPDRSKRSNVKF